MFNSPEESLNEAARVTKMMSDQIRRLQEDLNKCDGMANEINLAVDENREAVALLRMVIGRMNRGVSYWGDAFSSDEYNRILDFLEAHGFHDWER